MKNLILISLLLNVGLAAAVGFAVTKKKGEATEAASKSTNQTTETKTKRAEAKAQSQVEGINEAGQSFSWRDVESADYKEYIANLRAIQCPEETVRDIIIADVNKFYAERLNPFRTPKEEWKFWRNENNWGGRRESEDFYKQQSAIQKEKSELLKELLGSNYEEEMAKQYGWTSPIQDPFNQSLTQEIKDQLSEIQRKFGEKQSEIYRKARGYHDEDVQNDLRLIEKERRAEMAKVLSPEQLFEWDLRHSSTAQNMKWQMQAFDATEDEFRAIFKMKVAAEEARATASPDEDKAQREGRHNLENQVRDELKATLGEERYKEYQRSEDHEYTQLVRIADRHGVDKASVVKVYEMKDQVQKAAGEIRADKTLTPEQRREKLLEIRNLTEQEVTSTLGERGFKAWKQNAWWLRNLVPPEPRPAPNAQ